MYTSLMKFDVLSCPQKRNQLIRENKQKLSTTMFLNNNKIPHLIISGTFVPMLTCTCRFTSRSEISTTNCLHINGSSRLPSRGCRHGASQGFSWYRRVWNASCRSGRLRSWVHVISWKYIAMFQRTIFDSRYKDANVEENVDEKSR